MRDTCRYLPLHESHCATHSLGYTELRSFDPTKTPLHAHRLANILDDRKRSLSACHTRWARNTLCGSNIASQWYKQQCQTLETHHPDLKLSIESALAIIIRTADSRSDAEATQPEPGNPTPADNNQALGNVSSPIQNHQPALAPT